MEAQQLRNSREKIVDKPEEEKFKQGGKEGLAAKQQAPITSPASPPSASSSPSHEFSFTLSLHSSLTQLPDTAKAPTSFAVDLSPADDIFFHGHLLPLHLLSHLPVSPRLSTNSLDSFTLPIRDLIDDQRPNKGNNYSSASNGNNNSNKINNSNKTDHQETDSNEAKGRSKPKPFSLFGWKKGCEVRDREEDKDKQKKKPRFDVSQVVKRYMRMVRPLLFFKGRRENLQFHRKAYSFSGNLSWRNKRELRGRRGEFSAPASMRTSPTNSGLLVATATLPSTSDSTMEELQAAIQAAIAHCKNSIAAEEKIKC